jgi:hypothetical protein
LVEEQTSDVKCMSVGVQAVTDPPVGHSRGVQAGTEQASCGVGTDPVAVEEEETQTPRELSLPPHPQDWIVQHTVRQTMRTWSLWSTLPGDEYVRGVQDLLEVDPASQPVLAYVVEVATLAARAAVSQAMVARALAPPGAAAHASPEGPESPDDDADYEDDFVMISDDEVVGSGERSVEEVD